MTERAGRCLNSDYCTLGDARTRIRLAPEAAFVCPECARPLIPWVGWRRARETVLTALGVLTVCGSAAAGFITAHSHDGEQAWQRVLALVSSPSQRKPPVIVRPAPPPPPVVTVLSVAYFMPRLPAPPVVTVLAYGGLEVLGRAETVAKPVRVILRIDGSDIITGTAAPLLARAYLSARHATDIGSAGTLVIGTQGDHIDAVQIASHGSADGLAALAGGQADIVLTARAASAAELGALPRPPVEQVVAQALVVVIVNQANPLAQLSFDQAQAVFGGDARLTGIARRYAGDDLSGADAGSTRLAVGGLPIGPLVGHMRDSQATAAAVAADPLGIGLVPSRFAGPNRIVTVLPPPPGRGPAKLRHPLRLVWRGADAGPEARDFVRFLLGPAGQAVLAASGFPGPPPREAPKQAPKRPPPAAAASQAPGARAPEKDPFGDMEKVSETEHVFTMPANSRLVPGPVDKVTLTGDPAAVTGTEGDAAKLPAPSPSHGLMKVACTIELTGVPSHCQVKSAHGTKSGSGAVLSWLTSGQVRYAPAYKDGKPIVAIRELTVSYRPPRGND